MNEILIYRLIVLALVIYVIILRIVIHNHSKHNTDIDGYETLFGGQWSKDEIEKIESNKRSEL